MNSLVFPDVNVWLALAAPEHVHHASARRWWEQETGRIFPLHAAWLFAVDDHSGSHGQQAPLTLAEAWQVHDRLFEDDRVAFVPEPAEVETHFRNHASGRTASPKIWADAWLLAVAEAAEGTLITLDREIVRWPHAAPLAYCSKARSPRRAAMALHRS